MPLKTEAVQLFLASLTHPDLASLYSHDMECQVNVAQDGGERTEGEFRGRKWNGWTDGFTVWKPFRIPWNAAGDAEYTDSELKFDLVNHAEGIGMTGWDWKNRCSRWVAFDFDAIVGHSERHEKKLTPAEMSQVETEVRKLPWVTLRKSTGGKGLHVYVFLDPPVETANHTEHAALARAILGRMSALVGFDFKSKVDICGGNMWVWHRKMKNTDGLTLLQAGEPLREAPVNWRDHLVVTSNKKRRNSPKAIITNTADDDLFEELCGQHTNIPLDDIHKRVIQFLEESQALWWWDQDRHMMVCHTADLKSAHNQLKLRGIFETLATGAEHGADQNCFAFPLRGGAWSVRRHTPGVAEHPTWEQDGNGWTRCYYNREPDLETACRAYGGVEDSAGGFVFPEAELAMRAADALGAQLDIPPRFYTGRQTRLEAHKKDGRLICKFKHEDHDNTADMQTWLPAKGWWTKIHNVRAAVPDEPDVGNFDETVRHLVTESGDDYGWMVNSDGSWRTEPLAHVKAALQSMGHTPKDVVTIIGTSVLRCWKMVNRPFQPEYSGNREWNRGAAQFRFQPTQGTDTLKYPTWMQILKHVGAGLNDAIQKNGWCKANGILTGADYLKCWLASIFQEPAEPTAYLFLYGHQGCGKSMLHEAFQLLVTKGYQRADIALTSQSGFNGELENAILCVVEEVDLGRNKIAYNRIKDWVTSRQLNIRHLYQTPYHVTNTTHWIQCANDHNYCPIFPGDTRITMINVPDLDPTQLVPKKAMMGLLEKEAPDFLAELLALEIPQSNDRLNVPVIETSEKLATASQNQNAVEAFIAEHCYRVEGESIRFSEFFEKFVAWLDPNDVADWTKVKVGRELPPAHPRGRASWDNSQRHIGNLSFEDVKKTKSRIVLRDDFLRHTDES